ncbi:FHA domain-containing protein [Planctomyces sp. SH-PL62]|uniref:FHA domain-containing protein n=1 Tax=Planctomyces sp. SH-PL62 TaxID=1636152 RepID=UPI00078E97A2|nr:FHA domain-containing protein [Planctomyces sp. SH-PL62]AMV37485.1 FHA domain protein [Planctomyces sp. SH-PL62]
MKESPIDLFRGACGMASPWVLRCQEAGREEEMEARLRLALPYVLIGREVNTGLRLTDDAVSRRHAFLQLVDGRPRVFDLASRAGVVWEGARAAEAEGLAPGLGIKIGPYRLSWGVDDPGSATPPVVSGPPPSAALVLPIRVKGKEAFWRIEEDLVIVGRSGDCGLVLTDESVSRHHAAFIRTRLGVWVVDLESREGVIVSGARVRWSWLDEGDTIRIGRLTFGFRYLKPPSEIVRSQVPLESGAFDAALAGPARRSISASRRSRSGRELRVRESHLPAATGGESGSMANVPEVLPPQTGEEASLDVWRRQMEMMESFQDDMMLMARTFFAMHQEQAASVRDELARLEALSAELETLKTRLDRKREEPDETPAPRRAAKTVAAESPPVAARTKARPRTEVETKSDDRPGEERPQHGDPTQLHTALTHRISRLQRERQGCWRRILERIQS